MSSSSLKSQPRRVYPLPRWSDVHPTYIDGNFWRYELQYTTHEVPDLAVMPVLIKLPTPAMQELNCDACAGPHAPLSPLCTGNKDDKSESYLTLELPPYGGLYIYHLFQQTRLPGIYYLEDLVIRGKVGQAVLRRH